MNLTPIEHLLEDLFVGVLAPLSDATQAIFSLENPPAKK